MAARNPITARHGRRDPLPVHFDSLEEVAEFWDTHDSSEYEDYNAGNKGGRNDPATPRSRSDQDAAQSGACLMTPSTPIEHASDIVR